MKKCFVALGAALLVAGCGHTHTGPAVPSQSATGSVHPAGWGLQGPSSSELLSLAPSRTVAMFDTTTVSTVPARPFALAGYTGGFWPTFRLLRRRWPSAHTVSIAISAREHAACLDVEPGDATPGEVVGWYWADRHAGYGKPCVYSDWWEYTHQIRPVLTGARINRSQVWEWDASYTGRPHIDPGFDATQWTDKAFGRNLDESLVLRSFLSIAHPALKPAPKPRPKPKRHPHSTRLQRRVARRAQLRRVLVEQHCRVKSASAHCRALVRRGGLVNREIRSLGGH